MKVIRKEKKKCYSCMEEHEVSVVQIEKSVKYNDELVNYNAIYEYCEETDDLTATEEMIRTNDISMKDAYREQKGLMTSREIKVLRDRYQISQTDFSMVLGWGGKTITRYESYQVQDAAHDNILKRIQRDPQWFLELLSKVRRELPESRYLKYYRAAIDIYSQKKNEYTEKMLYAMYAERNISKEDMGNVLLNLDKVVESINYIASHDVASLYSLKLMRMLWYADCLNYKRNKQSITGMAYTMRSLGVAPLGYEYLTTLSGVSCEEKRFGEGISYLFIAVEKLSPKHLSQDEMESLDCVIEQFKTTNNDEMTDVMNKESAIVCSQEQDVISYEYAKNLSIA